MILRTIPRSWRAAVALAVMLGGLSLAFNMLPAMFALGEASAGRVAGFGLSLLVGIIATISFYYFQSVDGEPDGQRKELAILNRYHEAAQRDARARQRQAVPVFSSHGGAAGQAKPHRSSRS